MVFCESCREEVEDPDGIASLHDCPKCGANSLSNFGPHPCETCGGYAKRSFNRKPAKEQDNYIHVFGKNRGVFCSIECAAERLDSEQD